MTEYGKTVHACMQQPRQTVTGSKHAVDSPYFGVNGGRQGILFTVLRR